MKKIPYKRWGNKRWQKVAGIIGLLGMVAIGVIVGINTFEKKDEVSAHPTNTITIGQGGAIPTLYDLPTDATQLTEDRLLTDPVYKDTYKQNDGYVLNPKKINVKGFSTLQAKQVISYSEKTDNGNILAVGTVTTWDTGVSYQFSTTFAILLDQNNDFLASKIIDKKITDNPLLNLSLNQNSGGLSTTVTDVKKLPDGSYNMLAGAQIFNVKLNASETGIASVTRRDATFNGAAPNEMRGYNSVQIGLDDKIYYSGHWYMSDENSNYLNNGRTIAILNSNGNEEKRLKFKYTPCPNYYSNPSYMRIQQLSAIDRTSNNEVFMGLMTYTSLDSKYKSKIVSWDPNGNMVNEYDPDGVMNVESSVKVLNKISSTSERYFFVRTSTKSEIVKFSSSTGQFSQVVEFPANTDMEIIRMDDGSYNAIGYLSTVTGIFAPFQSSLNGDSTFVANFSNTFSLNSIVSMETKLQRPLTINTAAFLDNSRYFFGARFDERNVNSIPSTPFIDGFLATLGTQGKWTSKANGARMGQQNIFGILEMKEDHKPAIEAPDNIIYNVNDRDLDNSSAVNNQYGWTIRDNWLITGKKTGQLTDSSSIRIYDVYDIEMSLNPQPNSWHYNRLNRNPLNPSGAMEWAKLGLDESNTGPQLLTYFGTDTQNQVTTRSRWINKTTDQTVIDKDDKYALDAQNFHVPLSDIANTIPDEVTFKKYAKTMAWSLTKHGATDGDQGNGLDEDGTDSSKLSGKVKVDPDQLKALQGATEAKPYPVDVVYTTADSVVITNRVWVFTTVKNTLPNTETNPAVGPTDTNGVVYYADDYSMPFRLRGSHTDEDVRTRGNIRVYDYYDNSHETDAVLPTLVDMSNATERAKLEIRTINQVRNAPSPGILNPPISVVYKWDRGTDNRHTNGVETIGSLDITLFSDALLHVRQVVRDPSDEIVIPDEGYVTFKKTLDNSGSPAIDPNYHSQAAVLSGKAERTLDFTTFAVNTDDLANGADQLNLEGIIPEFYQYEGYYLTDQTSDPTGVSHKTIVPPAPITGSIALNRTTIDNLGEFWLTIYIKPIKETDGSTNKTPQPYSWNYQHNDLGKIEPKQ